MEANSQVINFEIGFFRNLCIALVFSIKFYKQQIKKKSVALNNSAIKYKLMLHLGQYPVIGGGSSQYPGTGVGSGNFPLHTKLYRFSQNIFLKELE